MRHLPCGTCERAEYGRDVEKIHRLCYKPNICVHPNSYVEALTLKLTILEGGALRK